MKTVELRKSGIKELKKLLRIKKDSLASIKLDFMRNKKKDGNIKLISNEKKDLARILTIIKEKEIHEKN